MIIGNFIKGIELKHRNHYFSGVCFDSSKCKKDNIFFAIKGNKTNGNKFINHAIKKEFKNHQFAGLSFNSEDCKKNYIFLQSKEQNQMELNS